MARTSEQLTPAEILAVSQMLPLQNGKYLTNDGTNVSWGSVAGGLSWGASASGTSGDGLALTINDNASANTRGEVITIGNTQTNPATALLLDCASSAVGHVALDVRAYGASTSQRGVRIGTSSGDAIPVELTTGATDKPSIKFSTGFSSATPPAGASKYLIVDINGTQYKILAQAIA